MNPDFLNNAGSASGKTILLADNEQFIAIAYRDGLERAGYSVAVASDGQEALDILRARTPDAIVLDLMLPKVNGFEVLQALKNDAWLSRVPVLVLTDLAQETDEAEARSYHIADFLVKSDTSLQDLLTHLQNIL